MKMKMGFAALGVAVALAGSAGVASANVPDGDLVAPKLKGTVSFQCSYRVVPNGVVFWNRATLVNKSDVNGEIVAKAIWKQKGGKSLTMTKVVELRGRQTVKANFARHGTNAQGWAFIHAHESCQLTTRVK